LLPCAFLPNKLTDLLGSVHAPVVILDVINDEIVDDRLQPEVNDRGEGKNESDCDAAERLDADFVLPAVRDRAADYADPDSHEAEDEE